MSEETKETPASCCCSSGVDIPPKNKRSIWEIVVFMVVILVVVAVGYSYVCLQNKEEKERALIYQLKTVRTAVQIYITTFKTKPIDLKELVTKTTDKVAENVVKLNWSAIKMDQNGVPIDPFDNYYIYDSNSGWVKTITKGYESW